MADAGRMRLEDLERALVAMGDSVEYPPLPDLAAMVTRRLSDVATVRHAAVVPLRPRARTLRRPSVLRPLVRSSWQPAAAVVLAVAVGLSALLTFSPGARRAVADFLGLRGARIEVVPSEPTPSPVPTSVGGPLILGERVSLAEAQQRVPFRILLPSDPRLGPPDEVYLTTRGQEPQVFLVWSERPGFPPASFTGAGLLLSEFRARVDGSVLEKKLLGPGTTLRPVRVNGGSGFWIAGRPHVLLFLAPDGSILEDTVRLAGNVLLWEQGELTLRIEGALTIDQALSVASGVG